MEIAVKSDVECELCAAELGFDMKLLCEPNEEVRGASGRWRDIYIQETLRQSRWFDEEGARQNLRHYELEFATLLSQFWANYIKPSDFESTA
jgi:hypothetical protein